MGSERFGEGCGNCGTSTKDKDGEEVKDVKYIELYDEKSNQLTHPQYLWTEAAKPIEPGEKTSVKLGTSADNLFVVQKLDKNTVNDQRSSANYSFLKLNNEKKKLCLPYNGYLIILSQYQMR